MSALSLLAAALGSVTPAYAQQTLPELTATPEATADLFIRSVRAIQWSAAAQFMAEPTLERFRNTTTMIVDPDSTGESRRYLVQTDSLGMLQLSAAEVFSRTFDAVIAGMPGLTNAFYDRDDEVLGAVMERSDSAHVVYRTTARLSGAVPEVKVMQLARGAAGWRVLWSDELAVLDAALQGVRR
jgi:hypothetical protein